MQYISDMVIFLWLHFFPWPSGGVLGIIFLKNTQIYDKSLLTPEKSWFQSMLQLWQQPDHHFDWILEMVLFLESYYNKIHSNSSGEMHYN